MPPMPLPPPSTPRDPTAPKAVRKEEGKKLVMRERRGLAVSFQSSAMVKCRP